MSISVEHRDGVAILRVDGEVDLATAPNLTSAVAGVLAERPPALVIDLSAVGFLGSAGLQVLAQTHQTVSGWADFAVVATGPATRRPIQLTALDTQFCVHEALDDALLTLWKNIGRRSS